MAPLLKYNNESNTSDNRIKSECLKSSITGLESEEYVNWAEQYKNLVLHQKTLIQQQQCIIDILSAKIGKFEKADSEEQDLKNLNKHTKLIKIFVSISFALLVIIGIVILVLHYTNHIFNGNSDFTPTTEPGGGDDDNLGNHQVLDRKQWGGREAQSYEDMKTPVPMAIIKHTGGGQCFSFQECAGKVQTIQSQGVSSGLPDIKYSFLIGGDGNIYVGRGWDRQPDHIPNTIDIAFMGSYAFDVLTTGMIEAAQLLLEDGLSRKKLTEDYKLVAHNQTAATESPGSNVYKEIIKWPHYDPSVKIDEGNWTKKLKFQRSSLKGKLASNKKYIRIAGVILILSLSAIITYVILLNINKPLDDDDGGISGDHIGRHRVYYKEDWGGRPAKAEVPLNHPTDLVIISHTTDTPCDSFQSCSSQVRKFQDWHFSQGNNDIGYNFLIGGDANVYVGRGWDVKNFHNVLSIGISFIGDFNFDEFTPDMIDVAQLLIKQGLDLNKLSQEYSLIGHNQSSTKVPLSPGINIYREIKRWPHFSNKTYF